VIVAFVATAVASLLGGHPAQAHTELESSTPAAGETVDAPVAEITLVWTGPVSPIEGGFEVLDPAGQVRRPTGVTSPAPDTEVLSFDPPLAGGAVGLRWAVAAADGHIIEGAFSFTVDAPAPTTTTVPATTTTVPPTTTIAAPTTTAPAQAPAPSATAAPPAPPPTTAVTGTPTTGPPVSLEDFLGAQTVSASDLRWRRLAQVLGVVAVTTAVGLLAFVTLIVRNQRAIDVALLRAASLAAVVAAGAAVLEAAAHAGAVTGRGLGVLSDLDAVFDASGDTYTAALLLRLFGGGVLAVGAGLAAHRATRAAAATAVAGAAALVASYAFDGHTVSKGNRVVQTLADVVHVTAASIWVGGLLALTWVAWRRWRRRPRDGAGAVPGRLDDAAFLGLAVRWSALAAWVLLAVAAAGAAMALSIIDGWGDLTGTGWGKVLLFKLAVTLVAAACGAYNRFALIPALDRRPSDPNVRERIVDALAAEAFVLVVAAVLAGVLVGATI
jgi:copper transport protein